MSHALVKSKEKAPREAKKTKDSTFDRIFKFYYSKNRIVLRDKEEEIRDRWYTAWQLLCNTYTRNQVAKGLAKQFGITERQGFQDVDNAMKLFSDPKNTDKLAKRAISEEWTVKGIKKAWDNGDLLSYERLIRRYNRINGLENEENPLSEWIKNQKPVAVLITADPKELEKAAAELMKDVPDVHDIPYQEVEDEEAA